MRRLKVMIFHRAIPLFLSALAPLAAAADFPSVPGSDRVLSTLEVKNFWVNQLQKQPLPPEGTRLHPEQLERRQRAIERRREMIEAVRAGQHDIAARLVCLSHNVEAWNRLGDQTKAFKAERQLLRLREHVATMAKLEAERAAAVKVGETVDRLNAMQAEIDRLKQLEVTLISQ